VPILRRHHGGVFQVVVRHFKLCAHTSYVASACLTAASSSFNSAALTTFVFYAVHLRFIDQPRTLGFRCASFTLASWTFT